MKTKAFILSATVMGMMLGACSQNADEQLVGNAGQEANFQIAISPLTRTTTDGYATTFAENDEIGIFEGNNATNVKYTLESDTWIGAKIYFPQEGNANFFAYYPWIEDSQSSFIHKVDADQSAGYNHSDLLISKGEINDTNVSLQFKHALALVEVDASALQDINIENVSIKAIAESNVDLTNQSVTASTTAQPITIKMNKYGMDAKYRAVLPAQILNAGKKITISANGTNYQCSIPEARLQAAKLNKFTLNAGTVEAVFTVGNIDNWGNGSSFDVSMPENGNLLTMTDEDLIVGDITVKDKASATGWYFNWYNANGMESTCKVIEKEGLQYIEAYLKAQANGNFDNAWEKNCGYTEKNAFKPGVYILNFKAHTSATETLRLGIYCQAPVTIDGETKTKIMLVNQYPYGSGWYNGNMTKDITAQEQEYTVEFDLNYITDGPYGVQKQPTKVTDETLAMLHFGFYNATKKDSYETFYIHDLQLFYKGESQGLKPEAGN